MAGAPARGTSRPATYADIRDAARGLPGDDIARLINDLTHHAAAVPTDRPAPAEPTAAPSTAEAAPGIGWKTVETDVWRPDADRPGYLLHVRDRTVGEVYDDLRAIIGEHPDGGEEYFTLMSAAGAREASPLWPQGRIVVFSVTGSNEGDYVHVEVLDDGDGRRELVILAKTFAGRDASWAFARRLADLLGA